MTSGRSLTNQERAAILRLASQRQSDGNWLMTYENIAKRLGISERTVRRVMRESAVRFGLLGGWKADSDRC